MPWDDIERLSRIGFVGLLIVILFLLYTGKLRWGWEVEEQEKEKAELKNERDRWMRAALKSTEVTRHAVRVVDKAASTKTEAADGTGDTESTDD